MAASQRDDDQFGAGVKSAPGFLLARGASACAIGRPALRAGRRGGESRKELSWSGSHLCGAAPRHTDASTPVRCHAAATHHWRDPHNDSGKPYHGGSCVYRMPPFREAAGGRTLPGAYPITNHQITKSPNHQITKSTTCNLVVVAFRSDHDAGPPLHLRGRWHGRRPTPVFGPLK
jgi:hypothetical protein